MSWVRTVPAIDDIDIGQRWQDQHTGDHFKVLRTYRDHPTNPTFLVKFEPPAPGWAGGGTRTVTFGFFRSYCSRAED